MPATSQSTDDYIPRNLLSAQTRPEVVHNVLETYAKLKDRSLQQIKLSYLRVCETLKLYGSTFFAVQVGLAWVSLCSPFTA